MGADTEAFWEELTIFDVLNVPNQDRSIGLSHALVNRLGERYLDIVIGWSWTELSKTSMYLKKKLANVNLL